VYYLGPMIIGIGVGVLWVLVWAGTAGKGFTKAFRIGPALLFPIVIVWAAISNELCPEGECHDLWRTLPLHGALALAVLWHLALITVEKERNFYLLYAAIHLPAFYLFWVLAYAIATKFPL